MFRGRRALDGLDDDVREHIDRETEEGIARGLSREEARRQAMLAFGNVAVMKEDTRAVWGWVWAEQFLQDLRYALWTLRRNPGFATAAVITLALGIGATTTVFSTVNAVLLQPLPYRDADQLVRIIERAAPRNASDPLLRRTTMTWPEFAEWRTRARTLSDMVYTVTPPITLMPTPQGSARLSGALVSSNAFALLGGTALLGRTLEVPDDASGSNVVVISEAAWRRYFHADPAIIGSTIRLKTLGFEAGFLEGTPLAIVGVMPASFDFPTPHTDFWAPITEDSRARTQLSGNVVARLQTGVSIGVANDEANALGDGLRPKPTSGPLAQPLPSGVRRFDIEPLKEQIVAPSRPALRVLAMAVVLVLLIVCANVTNLLLARGTARQRELAVRIAVGAGRGRLIRQLFTESLVLAGVGGLLGAVLALGGVHLLRELAAPYAPGPFQISFGGAMLPRLHEIGVDGRVLALTVALGAATAFLIGVVPACAMSRVDHLQAIRQRGAERGTPRSRTWLLGAFVVGQLATATVLLVGAGLLLNSFNRLARVDPGWDASGVLTFYLLMPQDYTTARKAALIEELIAELRRLPHVRDAGFTYAGPLLALIDYVGAFVPPGRTPDEMRGHPDTPQFRAVSHDYLQTMGARLIAGRWFEARDDASVPPVIMVNRTVVRRLFGNEHPVGRLVHLDGRMDLPPQEIIGIVDDMRQARMDREAAPQMFMDYRQVLALTQAREMATAVQERLAFGFLSFAVRTDRDPAQLMPSVRALVARVDPAAGIDAMLPMEQLVASSLTRQRFYTSVLGGFAVIAATIGAIGIYGVLAFAVARRSQEIGIRMALGARPAQVLALVLGRGVALTAAGVLFGLAGAAVLTRYLAGMLYDLTPLDPATYAAVTTLYVLVAALASYLPARRAMQVDPIVALRLDC